jgi:hypothetical protein
MIGVENHSEIQDYDHYEERLKHSQEHKARKFVERGLIKYNHDGKCFVCEPIEGYNTRTYQLRRTLDGRFRCNCQFITTQEHKVGLGVLAAEDMKPCSHIAALIICFREKRFV